MANKNIWIIWGSVTLIALGFYGYRLLFGDNKELFLAGTSSHGHYQIELACSSCHTEAFGGPEVLQDACVGCHGEELEIANDSHPKSKFTDPRNADRVEILDARYCITCHTEHQSENTLVMGLTIPQDYCYHCHVDIEQDRSSHAGMGFNTCASAGCHNYHDNRALYEDFLLEHATQADLLADFLRPALTEIAASEKSLSLDKLDAPVAKTNAEIANAWYTSNHALAGVNCSGCHTDEDQTGVAWLPNPELQACRECHVNQAKSFLMGKHGMRLAADLSPIQPQQARAVFNLAARSREHGCNSCHQAHDYNTQSAAVTACLDCHADEHSLAFLDSPHGKQWSLSLTGDTTTVPISCATCHMPRVKLEDGSMAVQHNQNDNLRPNEKMIRSVCMNCHGLGFALDALADENLIRNNFNGRPGKHIPSIDMAVSRDKK